MTEEKKVSTVALYSERSVEEHQIVQVALSAFFNIMKEWHVRSKEQIILLGNPFEFDNWKKGKYLVYQQKH